MGEGLKRAIAAAKATRIKPVPDCKFCGQPMKPIGVRKRKNEYDHASGCPVVKE